MNALNHIDSMAFAAFEQHYNTTKRPGWNSADDHWNQNVSARELWCSIVMAVVLVARQLDASAKPETATLPGLGAPLPASWLDKARDIEAAARTARVEAMPRLPRVEDGPTPGLAIETAVGFEDKGAVPDYSWDHGPKFLSGQRLADHIKEAEQRNPNPDRSFNAIEAYDREHDLDNK